MRLGWKPVRDHTVYCCQPVADIMCASLGRGRLRAALNRSDIFASASPCLDLSVNLETLLSAYYAYVRIMRGGVACVAMVRVQAHLAKSLCVCSLCKA